MARLHHSLRNLVTNERGTVAMTFGLTAVIAVTFVGGAVDFGRAYQQKSRMQNALDAAVVSAVARYRESNDWTSAEAMAINTFKSTFTNAVQPTQANPTPTVVKDQPLVTFTRNGSQISGAATMQTNTPFLQLAVGRHLQVGANSNAIPPSGRQLEVAVMVDLTGSMGWDASAGANPTNCSVVSNPTKKIDYLKCAGEDLLNILLPTTGANDANVKIGIAPFADKVNAGTYASAVTGLASSGGAFEPISNLYRTKQGAFSGTYSGANTTAATQPAGAQFGATGASVPSGGVNTAGGTYSNNYCSPSVVQGSPGSPGQMLTTNFLKADNNNHYVGAAVTLSSGATKPNAVFQANPNNAGSTVTSTGRKYRGIDEIDYEDDGDFDEIDVTGARTSGYYVPVVTSLTGLTPKVRTANGYTGPVGVRVSRDNDTPNSSWRSAIPVVGLRRVGANGVTGYWKVSNHNGTDWTDYTWVTTQHEHFVRVFESLETVATPAVPDTVIAGCESAPPPSQPTSQLISCVTERKNGTALDFTADAPASSRYIGPYNHGSTTKSNYSSDGKCYSSGRELPAVIPLTNDRSTLTSFFSGATVGGATAGHLGTAWASYILSPNWSSIWPSGSTPAPYTTSETGVKKAAILMTDGEYNIQFSTGGVSTNTSAKQALMLCKQMRDAGIKVYTVGFGFGEGVQGTNITGMSDTDRTTPGTGTAQQRAIDTLSKCASDNNSYYFPYDGESLRTVFKNIANGLSSDISGGKARLTN